MASKSPAPADAPEAIEEQAVEPDAIDVAEQPEAEAPAVAPEAAGGEPVDIAEVNARPIPMRHSDGNGACDLYKQDGDGNILVPAVDAARMIEHGFVVVHVD